MDYSQKNLSHTTRANFFDETWTTIMFLVDEGTPHKSLPFAEFTTSIMGKFFRGAALRGEVHRQTLSAYLNPQYYPAM